MKNKLTKKEMVEIIINSPAWDGTKDVKYLLKENNYENIKDIYDELDEAEDDFFGEN